MMRAGMIVLLLAVSGAAAAQQGKAVYDKACALCHAAGIAGAPKLGHAADWTGRASRGTAVLYNSALIGTARGMPARGGNLDLKDADVKAAVDFMLSQVPAGAAKPAAKSPERKPETKAVEAAPVAPKAPSEASAASVPASSASSAQAAADVNSFNRLLRPPSRHNPPPAEDGIHDPANDGTHALQAPRAAYGNLPKSNAGNRIDWVRALGQKAIQPRWDRLDPKASGMVLDLNIVREVKGSMPDVVYPHKQHTEVLDCSNCHPAIFVPQKGANQISMASILLGEKCGVCHGKVAFPVSECRLCHSKKKELSAK